MMNPFRVLQMFILVLLFSTNTNGQDILMTIGDKEISLEEFERIYNKNNNDISGNQQTPEEYLDLFVNFKLKVLEAENRGMDTTKKFINEFNGYKNQLAKPYLMDEESMEEMIREAYERAQVDLHASHILVGCSSKASPEDTLQKYNKIMAIRERIMNGEDFHEVARATSDDPSARTNGGELGYFTVFDMMYPFENGAYALEVGEVSYPVRTMYGYHLIRLNKKRPAMGQLKVAHIYIATPEDMTVKDRVEAREKMYAIADSIANGADFGKMAERHSDDRNSARNGGELPWFGNRRMIPEFENAALALEKPGDVSKPFESTFGWHLVRLIDRKPVGTFEEMRPTLESKVFKGDREREKLDRYYDALKEAHQYSRNEEVFSRLYSIMDSSYYRGEWNPGQDVLNSEDILFTLSDTAVTLGTYTTSLFKDQKEIGGLPMSNLVELRYDQFVEKFLMEYEKSKLPEKYPEYRYILQEYHDGILLFEIMDKEVWSKAVKDTTGLEAFFEEHRDDYMWGERISATIVSCDSTVNFEKVHRKAGKIASGKWDENKLNHKFCSTDTVACIQLEDKIFNKGENERANAIGTVPGVGAVFAEDGMQKFMITREVIPPQHKELSETRGRVTSDYQDHLEKLWIAHLREKYPVEVNKELLKKIN